ncbi:MAG: hypothetical protein M3O15_16440, partial [Acidobacteriota bacterium]|nr:hypothetical protein [Acidobacteriota bacterium]
MAPPAPPAFDEPLDLLEETLATSPADSTEILWLDIRRGHGSIGTDRHSAPGQSPASREHGVLIRVRESGRTGLFRTGSTTRTELENGVRDALAQARLARPTPTWPLAPGPLPSPRPAAPAKTFTITSRTAVAISSPAGTTLALTSTTLRAGLPSSPGTGQLETPPLPAAYARLVDPELVGMTDERARDLLRQLGGDDERAAGEHLHLR